MKTRDKVVEWLDKHKGSDVIDTDATWEHFVNIVTSVADYCLNRQLAESAKWITENVSPKVAEEYHEFMEASHD